MTSLEHLVAVARRRWLAIAVVVGVCLVGAVAIAAISGSTYEASARVLFNARSLPDAALQVQRGSTEPERDAATNVLLASSRSVAERVARELGGGRSPSSLLDDVRVEARENADVLEITASAGDADEAARIANAFATEFVAARAASDRRGLTAAEDDLRRQLAAAGPDERPALRDALERVAALRAVAGADARVIGRAVAPSSAASLGPLRAAAIGLVIGVALALALAFALEALDRRLATIESVERAYGVGALAVVGDGRGPAGAGRGPLGSVRGAPGATGRGDALEPYRIVRGALDAATVGDAPTVLVTSASPGEGRTTVAAGLAHALALTGRRVVLVELDLRAPALRERFDLGGRDGVVAALQGRASASELLERPLPSVPELWVLPAGPPPANPAELLQSPALDALLADLREDDATLVIDAPALVPVADAQELLGRADATVVVARLGVTGRDDAARARAILDRHRVEPLGLVMVERGSVVERAQVERAEALGVGEEIDLDDLAVRHREAGHGEPPLR